MKSAGIIDESVSCFTFHAFALIITTLSLSLTNNSFDSPVHVVVVFVVHDDNDHRECNE